MSLRSTDSIRPHIKAATIPDYIGLKARLSKAWLSAPLLILIFYIVKLSLLRTTVHAIISIVKRLVLSECESIDDMINRAMDAPQEALNVANRLIENSVNGGLKGLMTTMNVTLTAIESLILFCLQMTIGTYSCLTISAVNVAANEAVNATESVLRAVNTTVKDIGRDINSGLGKLSSFINGAQGLINSVDEFVTGSTANLKSVNLTVSKLDHLNISSNINQKLESARHHIPNYDSARIAAESAISKPFEGIRRQITRVNTTVKFNMDNFRPASLFNKGPHCDASKLAKDFDTLKHKIDRLILVLWGICGLLIILGIILNTWKEWQRWKLVKRIVGSLDPFTDSIHELKSSLQNLAFAETGYMQGFLLLYLPDKYWWSVQYMFSPPLSLFLVVGVSGLIMSSIELGVVSMLQNGARKLYELETESLKDIEKAIDLSYSKWTNTTNGKILSLETGINKQILGWLHEGTAGINGSISKFMTGINQTIDDAFNGTSFQNPLQDVVKCLIGDKVKAVEQGLTWLNHHSQVDLAKIPTSLFTNATKMYPIKIQSAAGKAMNNAIDAMKSGIHTQLIVFGALLSIWVLFSLIAVAHINKGRIMTFVRSNGAPIPPYGHYGLHESRNKPASRVFVKKMPNEKVEENLRGNIPPKLDIPTRSFSRRDPIESPRIIPSPGFRNGPPSGGPVRSPIDRLRSRVTQFFTGPAQSIAYDVPFSPDQGSIVIPETPMTPSRTMIH